MSGTCRTSTRTDGSDRLCPHHPVSGSAALLPIEVPIVYELLATLRQFAAFRKTDRSPKLGTPPPQYVPWKPSPEQPPEVPVTQSRRIIMIAGAVVAAWLAGTVLVVMWIGGVAKPSAESVAYTLPLSPQSGALPILWPAPAFSYADQNGQLFSDKDLRGHIWVSDFIFTSCTSICPMMTARMARLQEHITDSNVQFVSFSVDPDHDTTAVLRQYATMWKADDARWRFLSTDRKRLAATAAGMRTFVQPPDRDTPIQHSSIFILTDGEGQVRGVYDSNDDIAMLRLVKDVLRLSGGKTAEPQVKGADALAAVDEFPEGEGTPGAAIYAALGCVGCHSQGRVAPSLAGCFGRKVQLADGRTVTADEAYLRESILDPATKVVAGYPSMMPGYRGQITDAELGQLMEYLKSSRANSAAGTDRLKKPQAIDPVCKMALPEPPQQVEFEGRTYYFCSVSCRDRFLKEPARYRQPAGEFGK
jgi:protein SCO1